MLIGTAFDHTIQLHSQKPTRPEHKSRKMWKIILTIIIYARITVVIVLLMGFYIGNCSRTFDAARRTGYCNAFDGLFRCCWQFCSQCVTKWSTNRSATIVQNEKWIHLNAIFLSLSHTSLAFVCFLHTTDALFFVVSMLFQRPFWGSEMTFYVLICSYTLL